ncbi:hypothetical protein [Rickettsiella endosymbiont of Dermanyssus gallinae]|uniref:hypothetical protein n=1 Tax=Rickettsiella endosymbiont of Dermanyssus gallinae TaxID=2856608 RepID=UPI001C52F2C0|nr:hypothetical protein [Rickettsiella endosymbiont of Dermanyssus gallinae]
MPAGRPTKLTPEIAKSIIHDLAQLIPYGSVAQAHGITRNTLYKWITKGLDEAEIGKVSPFSQFSIAIKKNECHSIKTLLDIIRSGEKGWQSCAWILERRFASEFSLGAPELAQLKQDIEELKKMINEND